MKIPLAELRERFTLSEMVIVAWRSQEQHWQMKEKFSDKPKKKKKGRKKEGPKQRVSADGDRIQYDDQLVDSLPDEWFNEEGELDLSKATGPQAVQYLNAASKALGLPMFPMVGGGGK